MYKSLTLTLKSMATCLLTPPIRLFYFLKLLGINAAENNRAQLETIKKGTEEMKSMMVSVEEAEGVVSDSQEALDMVDKISLALSLPMSNSDTVSKEVDVELAKLIGETKLSGEHSFIESHAALDSKGGAQIPVILVSSYPSKPDRVAVPA